MLQSLPNALTLMRIAVIPIIVGLFFVPAPWAAWANLALFVLAAVTDYFDGQLARRLNIVSAFGKLLDPIADKMLVTAVLFMIVATGRIDGVTVVAAVIILLREILISGLREYMAGRSTGGLPVTYLAKWKTTVQMAALALLILGDAGPAGVPIAAIGIAGLWLAALLTVVTGWDYVASSLEALREERRAARADASSGGGAGPGDAAGRPAGT
jgi:cardiolipin synthase